MKLDTILVIGESSSDEQPLALRKALFLVQNRPIAIHLLCVVYDETDKHAATPEEDARQALKETLMRKSEADVAALLQRECPDARNVSYEVIWNKSASDAIDEACQRREFDLILKTGHRSETLLHVPTDFHLLRVPHVPVMVLPGRAWSAAPVVLATIDFHPRKRQRMALNRKVLACARQIADMESAALHCCYIITHSKVLMDMDVLEPREQLRKFREQSLEEMYEFIAPYGISPEQVHVKVGAPSRLIPSIANKVKADLVVIGTHHRSGLTGLLMGNTCEKVLGILRTAVLTVKPE